MKKKSTTLFLVMITVFVLVLSFVGCKEKTEENVSVDNSKLIADAFDGVLDSEYVHASIDNFEFKIDISDIGGGGIAVKCIADFYSRKSESGYDMAAFIDIVISMSDTDADTGKEYTDNSFLKTEMRYDGEYLVAFSKSFDQTVVDGAGYAYFNRYVAGDQPDAVVIEDFIEDYTVVDEQIGNTGETRVYTENRVTLANSLDELINVLVTEMPIFDDLGYNSVESLKGVLKRTVGSLSGLAEGGTKADANGNRVVALNVDLASVYNEFIGTVNDNMKNSLGTFLDTLLGKDPQFVASVVDRLFPAEGKCLTINQFIEELEDILAENGFDISFKEIVDEVQYVSGLTTQQIADVVNPLLEEMLDGTVSISINPKEGETLYDTLSRTVFDMVGVDTVLGLFSSGDSSIDGSTASAALTSARFNAMAKAMLYGSESITLEQFLANLDMDAMVMILSQFNAKNAVVKAEISLDPDNKLTGLELSVDGDISAVIPEIGSGAETQDTPEMNVYVDGSAKISVDYDVKEQIFELPDNVKIERKEYKAEEALMANREYSLREIANALGINVPENERLYFGEFRFVAKNGYISEHSNYSNSISAEDTTFYLYTIPEEYEQFYVIFAIGENYYIVEYVDPAESVTP